MTQFLSTMLKTAAAYFSMTNQIFHFFSLEISLNSTCT
uniref:Uncharacterized protein n=1 Tax=Rhizophora mucronata TaxID=61149 RepID=A0A2P2NZ27_RHIMU